MPGRSSPPPSSRRDAALTFSATIIDKSGAIFLIELFPHQQHQRFLATASAHSKDYRLRGSMIECQPSADARVSMASHLSSYVKRR